MLIQSDLICFSICISIGQRKRLRLLAHKYGLTMSWIIRYLIEELLDTADEQLSLTHCVKYARPFAGRHRQVNWYSKRAQTKKRQRQAANRAAKEARQRAEQDSDET